MKNKRKSGSSVLLFTNEDLLITRHVKNNIVSSLVLLGKNSPETIFYIFKQLQFQLSYNKIENQMFQANATYKIPM